MDIFIESFTFHRILCVCSLVLLVTVNILSWMETSIRICMPWILHHYLSYIIETAIRYDLYVNKVFNRSSENQIAICIILTRHQQKRVCACNALLSSNASFPWPCCMSYVAWQLGKYFTHGGTTKDSRVRWCIVLEGNLMGCSLSFIGKDLVK